MDKAIRFLVIGAGGIGAFYGARLQDAGHDVTFVARGQHLRKLQASGLKIQHPQFEFDQPVHAISMQQLREYHCVDDFALIVVTTKAGGTPDILAQLAEWLGNADGPPVLSLQNGIDNEKQIAAVVGIGRTLGGLAVRIGGHVIEPGIIEATGPAQVVMGAWPNDAENRAATHRHHAFVDAFNAAGIPTRYSDDIRLELWKKLLINNGVNPLSALTELDTRRLSNHPELGISVHELMHEAARAALSDGVKLSDQDIDGMFELIRTFDPIKTSMLVDYEKGRELELDEIAGAVIARCEAIGQPASLTRLVSSLLKLKLSQRPDR